MVEGLEPSAHNVARGLRRPRLGLASLRSRVGLAATDDEWFLDRGIPRQPDALFPQHHQGIPGLYDAQRRDA